MNDYLVNAAIAAAIGAGTNELAIIAILRYILPAKKSQIARRIRDIVATDLLSPDKMLEKLDDPQVGDLLRKNIDLAIDGFLSRDLPSPAELLAGNTREADALARRLRDSLLAEMAGRTADPAFATDIIRPFLAERWEALKARTPASLLSSAAEDLPDAIRSWVESVERSPALRRSFRRALDAWLSERVKGAHSLEELLSPGLAKAAEDLAASLLPAVVDELTGALRDARVQAAMADAVIAAVNEQLRGQGFFGNLKGVIANAMRVPEDIQGVCRLLPDSLREHLARPHNRERFEAALRGAVRNGLKRNLSADLASPVTRGRLLDLIMDHAWTSGAFADLGRRAAGLAHKLMHRSLAESAAKLGVDAPPDALLDEAAIRCRRMLDSPATRELAARQFDEFVADWKTKPLGRLGRFVNPEARSRVADVAAGEARRLLRLRLREFTEESGFWDIITDSVEAYDNRKLEDMVRQLARSELRWVTILGGVIGAVVGLAQTAAKNSGWW